MGVFFSLWLASVPPASAGYDEGAAAFIRGDYEAAWQEWLALGKRGHQSAQYNLGVLYSIGLGVEQDDVEASKWFRRAAERGLPAAQMRLGTAYLEGKGVPEDPKEAYFWYTLAATHFSLGEQHEQAVAARERTGADLTRAQITEVLEKAMGWKPLPQTMNESEKERLISEPNGEKSLVFGGDSSDGANAAAKIQDESQSQAAGAGDGTMRAAATVEEPPSDADVPRTQTAGSGDESAGPIAAKADEMGAPDGSDGAGMTVQTAAAPPAPPAAAVEDQDAGAAAGAQAESLSQDGSEAVATAMAAATEAADSTPQTTAESATAAPRETFAIHLSSVSDPNGTEAEWQRLREHFPELLDGTTLAVRTIEVADKGTFYRVMAGTFDSYDEAKRLCTQFAASDQYCVVRQLDPSK
jgi:TPR repeat protein